MTPDPLVWNRVGVLVSVEPPVIRAVPPPVVGLKDR
jgi:hypothetical protein